MSEPIETRTALLRRADSGVVRMVMRGGVEVGCADAYENLRALASLAGGTPVRVLCDLRAALSFSREARIAFSAPDTSAYVAAVACVVGSPVSRLIGNFFIGLNRIPVPTRIFSSEHEATDWLLAPKRHK